MKNSTRLSLLFLGLLVLFIGACSERTVDADKPPFDVDVMLKARIVTDIVPVPGGGSAVIKLKSYDGGSAYKYDLRIVTTEGTVTPITTDGTASGSFDVSPDGKSVVMAGSAGGKSGLVTIPLSGGAPSLLLELPVGADNVRWTAGGVFFTAMVFPICAEDFACTAKKLADKKNGSSMLEYDTLPYRRWNQWRDGRRSGLFVTDATGSRVQPVAVGDFDVPDFPLGTKRDYVVSTDGNTAVMSIKISTDPARTTTQNLYRVSRPAGGEFGDLVKQTYNLSADTAPQYSPDGGMIAYTAMDVPGNEAGLQKLRVMDLKSGGTFDLAETLDRPVRSFAWSADGSRIFFAADDTGYRPLFSVEVKRGAVAVKERPLTYVSILSAGSGELWYTRESFTTPPEIYMTGFDLGDDRKAAAFNDDTTGARSFGRYEEIWYDNPKSANGKPGKIHAFLVFPPRVLNITNPPLLMLIHGGPEGNFSNNFFTRWNAQAYASMGFAVAMPDFTGSYGYGQAFTDAVRDDWGGAPYNDIMSCMDYLDRDGRVNTKNACLAGGSYGGYMANWVEGHSTRFRCLVSHDGQFNIAMRYGSTDDLYFPEYEFLGKPWENPDSYAKWSPYRYVLSFKTPILVIHGELDYHLPIEQGIGMYEYAKMMGVEAKLMYFPDEGHLVLKPKNTQAHYRTIGDWIKAHTK